MRIFIIVLLLLSLGTAASSQEREYRKWQMRDGRRTRQEMKVADTDGRVVSLQREGSDRLVRVVISSLTDEDQTYLKEYFPEAMARREASLASATNSSPSVSTSEVRWPAPVVTEDNLEHWVTFIRPTKEDLKWRDIRWHNNLATAQQEARRLHRPILLWTMNGNPCGET